MDSESKTESSVVEDLEKKQPCRPATSQIVVETIKSLDMSNGASLEAIAAFIGECYDANVNSISASILRSLENGAEKGLLEQVADGGSMRFKLKNPTGQEIKTKPQVKEVPKKFKKNHSASDRTEKSTSKGKNTILSFPQMVVESIKALKMRNGAPVDAISQYMEEHYGVNRKAATPDLKRLLKIGVQSGVLENTSKAGAYGRFKVRKTAEIKTKPQVKEVPKKYLKKNPSVSDRTEKSTSKGKNTILSFPQMVVESIKALKMRNGAPVHAISQYMEEHYGLNAKAATPDLKRLLKIGVKSGVLENTSKAGADGRFKVRKMAEGKQMRKALKA